MLIEYVRNKEGQPIGAVVATGKNEVGWSEKHPRDKWNRSLALEIACGRSIKRSKTLPLKESVFLPIIEKMKVRSCRYFK